MTEAWARLFLAVKAVCDLQLVMHKPGPDPKNPFKHAEDCPGCELRDAYQAVSGESNPPQSAS